MNKPVTKTAGSGAAKVAGVGFPTAASVQAAGAKTGANGSAVKSSAVRSSAAKSSAAAKPAKVRAKPAAKSVAAPAVVTKPVAARSRTAAAKPVAAKAPLKPLVPKTAAKSVVKAPLAAKSSVKAAVRTPPVKLDVDEVAKARKPKLVRDSFTMPEQEYAVLGQVKKACLKAGIDVKKSELLRIGVALISQIDLATLKSVLAGLPQLKTGRPKSS